MTYFLKTHLGIVVLTSLLIGLGDLLVPLLPWRTRPAARAYLTPALGLTILIPPVTLWGWFGRGFAAPLPRIAFWGVLIAVLARLAYRGWFGIAANLRILGLTALISLPFTFCLATAGGFDFLNDAWTYLVQSQWLQSHALAWPPPPDAVHPALSQIHFTVNSGTRAGAQFLLAFVQGAFHLTWAHQAYPVVICAALAAGSLTVGFVVSLRPGGSSMLAALGSLFAGIGFNGLGFGALFGFLPQTVGLASAAMTIWVGGAILMDLKRRPLSWRDCFVPGLGISATLLAYGECIPLLGAAIGLAVFYHLVSGDSDVRLRVLAWSVGTIFVAAAIAAPELPRFFPAIRGQATAVVGSPVAWSAPEFALHSLGFRLGVWEHSPVWLGYFQWAAVMLGVLMTATAIMAATTTWPHRHSRRQWEILLPGVSFLVVAGLLFLWYRYFVPSPFPEGQGQSWSQFKLAGWSTLFLLGSLFGAVDSSNHRRGATRSWRPLLAGLTGLCVAIALVQGLLITPFRTHQMAGEIGLGARLLPKLERFSREVGARIGDQTPVRFSLQDPSHKFQQLLAYFFMDRPIYADWRTDGYVRPHLPKDLTTAELDIPAWLIARGSMRADAPLLSVGSVGLFPRGEPWFELQKVQGGHPREGDGGAWAYWTREPIQFWFRAQIREPAPAPATVRIRANLQSAGGIRQVHAVVRDAVGGPVVQRDFEISDRFEPVTLGGLPLSRLDGLWSIEFGADGPAVTLGPLDPREARMRVQMLEVSIE